MPLASSLAPLVLRPLNSPVLNILSISLPTHSLIALTNSALPLKAIPAIKIVKIVARAK